MNDQQRAAMQKALEALLDGRNLAAIEIISEALSAESTETCYANAQPQGEWVVDVRAKVLPVIGMVWDKTMNIDDALDQIDVLYTTPPREAFDCCVYQQKDGAVITSYGNQAQFERMLTKSPAVMKYVESAIEATKERCAKEAEAWVQIYGNQDIADAIRRLK